MLMAEQPDKAIETNYQRDNLNELRNITLDMSDPPSKDSPRHILELLSNDCIQLIFRKLNSIHDILNVAETCTRFQQNAIECFRYNCIDIHDETTINSSISITCKKYDIVEKFTVEKLSSLFTNFGHLIQSLKFEHIKAKRNNEIIQMIANCCGKTLKELTLNQINFDGNALASFHALKKLVQQTCKFTNFTVHSNLEYLEICNSEGPLNWIERSFPKLSELKLARHFSITDTILEKFMVVNPQLVNLHLFQCPNVTLKTIKNIVQHSVNLEKLYFKSSYLNSDKNRDTDVNLGQLCKLKSLVIMCSAFPIHDLIKSLSINQTPIESLKIHSLIPSQPDKHILQLKTLKTLHISHLTDDLLVKLVQQIVGLEEIIAIRCQNVTATGIKNALIYGTNLKLLAIQMSDDEINQSDWNAIRALAMNRVNIELECGVSEIESRHFSWLR